MSDDHPPCPLCAHEEVPPACMMCNGARRVHAWIAVRLGLIMETESVKQDPERVATLIGELWAEYAASGEWSTIKKPTAGRYGR